MKTRDFLDFRVLTLNGRGVQNKGMALLPRRIDGPYAMISLQDDENLLIMFSGNPHFWSSSKRHGISKKLKKARYALKYLLRWDLSSPNQARIRNISSEANESAPCAEPGLQRAA
jgi:hypothetical protein